MKGEVLMKLESKVFAGLNLYERNVYQCLKKNGNCIIDNPIMKWMCTKIHRYLIKDVLLKYVEVPITVRCTLCCEECCNLMQYYEKPYTIEGRQIVADVRHLARNVRFIKQIRILGGEPLVHKDLIYILAEIGKIPNIANVELVTNGTVLFSDELLMLLKDSKYSVDISNYKENSKHYKEIISSLRKNHIAFITEKKGMTWWAMSDIRYRNRNVKQLQKALKSCKMDCLNMLNGAFHLCPRSSHGMELKIVEERQRDVVYIRKNNSIGKELYNLLNTDYINACNYCDVFRMSKLKKVKAGKQIDRQKALLRFHKIQKINQERKRMNN